ncbi:cell division protein FtsL [Proteiniborus ethanoligenes]|uniref:Cell division protein FtsL n=1 Tax=Proteiniborus ethanoligenes TaxID=415015 RepID=A0A1H3JWH3_9FIRM|nr:cell division protein FtsL [Proteiniborus ethanoligenes]SDY43969.1 cell division protein FtsL [Proteiniborus ethanoligenes]
MLVAKKEVYSYYEDNNIDIKRTKKVTQNKKSNSSAKIKFFAVAFLILFVCLGVLFRYAQITQIKMEISKLEKDIKTLNKHKVDISLDLERIKESGWIEKEAETRLGMIYPTNEQVVYIAVNSYDIDSGIKVEEKSEKLGFLKLFSNVIGQISNKL